MPRFHWTFVAAGFPLSLAYSNQRIVANRFASERPLDFHWKLIGPGDREIPPRARNESGAIYFRSRSKEISHAIHMQASPLFTRSVPLSLSPLRGSFSITSLICNSTFYPVSLPPRLLHFADDISRLAFISLMNYVTRALALRRCTSSLLSSAAFGMRAFPQQKCENLEQCDIVVDEDRVFLGQKEVFFSLRVSQLKDEAWRMKMANYLRVEECIFSELRNGKGWMRCQQIDRLEWTFFVFGAKFRLLNWVSISFWCRDVHACGLRLQW